MKEWNIKWIQILSLTLGFLTFTLDSKFSKNDETLTFLFRDTCMQVLLSWLLKSNLHYRRNRCHRLKLILKIWMVVITPIIPFNYSHSLVSTFSVLPSEFVTTTTGIETQENVLKSWPDPKIPLKFNWAKITNKSKT